MAHKEELYDVVIVGCGSAGIAAAIDFQKVSSRKFVLLEGRNRVGGRAFTDTNTFGTDVPVDLGAQWMHHYRPENPLLQYNHSSINTHDQFILLTPSTPYFDIDGTRIPSETVAKAQEIFEHFCHKIEHFSSLTDISMLDVIKNEYDDYNDSQLKRLIDTLLSCIEQYEAADLDQLSAKSYMKSDGDLDEFDLIMPKGFGTFIKEIVEHYQLPIELNSIVTCIDTSSSDSIVRIYTKDGRIFSSKYVLVTVPLGCLKADSISFIPRLPDWKQHAIDTLGMGVADKILLQFPLVFWDPEWSAIICTSPRFRLVLCQPQISMLTVFVNGRSAIKIEQQNDQETIDHIMNVLRTIFSNVDVPEPSRYLVTRWGQDPLSRGAYANFAVNSNNQTVIDLARECNNRIYWAGEHTNYNGSIGCVDSAFESGQREAKRINQSLGEDIVSNK